MIVIVLLAISQAPTLAAFMDDEEVDSTEDEYNWNFITEKSYSEYLDSFDINVDADLDDIEIAANDYLNNSIGCSISDLTYHNCPALLAEEYSNIGWKFTVQKEGYYCLYIDYYTIPGKGKSIERSIMIDNEVPYQEAGSIVLSRIWEDKDKVPVYSGVNQIRSEQEQKEIWTGTYTYDSSAYCTEPLMFYLTKGDHTLRMNAISEAIVLGKLIFCPPPQYPTYSELLRTYENLGYVSATEGYKVQAEQMYLKSDPTIYPVCDFGSASMEPASTDSIKFNKVSGEKFQLTGQWIQWQIVAPESGLYEIAIKYKQPYKEGGYTSRQLKIDGDYPFEEAKNIKFNCTDNWIVQVLGSKKVKYQIYLSKGEHILELDVTLGDMAGVIGRVQNLIYDLNAIYRKIASITGVNPDIYRDYKLDEVMPEVITELKRCSLELKDIKSSIIDITGSNGSYLAIFEKLNVDLEIMWNTPSKIAIKLQNMKDNVSGLSSWMSESLNQPLDIDWISIAPVKSVQEGKTDNSIDNLLHSCKVFLASFYMDYNSIGDINSADNQDPITVWIGSSSTSTIIGAGRDQSQIIKQMSDNQFTPNLHIPVNLQLVAIGTLLTSIVAGNSPDIALQCNSGEPMNYAIRGALADLSSFDDYTDVESRFFTASLTPYKFNGKTYALPETMTYPMVYYRKDIFQDLGLELPKTWKDVSRLIIDLQKQNMQFGLPIGWGGYLLFLFQNGEKLYTEYGKSANLGSDVSLKAFKEWTNYFNSYGQPVQYDFINRFRSGEMPIAIADITMFNQLSISAPEIKNLWGLATVPGVSDENGEVNNSVPVCGTSCIILSSSENQSSAWEFLKWWTDADTQTQYSRELESIMGVSARYPTANKETYEQLSWSQSDLKSLKTQQESLVGIPEVPGSYIIPRYVTFAFDAVINQNADSNEALSAYIKQANAEINRKRAEFGLS